MMSTCQVEDISRLLIGGTEASIPSLLSIYAISAFVLVARRIIVADSRPGEGDPRIFLID